MEYQFSQINREGDVEVIHVYDNEVFKHWLNVEIAGCLETTQNWIDIFTQILETKKYKKIGFEQQWLGKEFTLKIENRDIIVSANFILQMLSDEECIKLSQENLSLDIEEFEGRADFLDVLHLLKEYYSFITSLKPD